MFQSTHPRGVRLIHPQQRQKTLLRFQSTHPRGVRLDRPFANKAGEKVSIHAPARGATRVSSEYGWRHIVSIHAPARGATSHVAGYGSAPCFNPRTREGCDMSMCSTIRQGQGFNPRTREGCDPYKFVKGTYGGVSIHAPARGATRSSAYQSRLSVFQSTHPRGVRHVAFKGARRHDVSIHAPARGATGWSGCEFHDYKFQSTHPRGVRPKTLEQDIAECRFQSTRSEEHTSVSIHAPARGATMCEPIAGLELVSIHAPARGATTDPGNGSLALWGFQSTHPRGVRLDASAPP